MFYTVFQFFPVFVIAYDNENDKSNTCYSNRNDYKPVHITSFSIKIKVFAKTGILIFCHSFPHGWLEDHCGEVKESVAGMKRKKEKGGQISLFSFPLFNLLAITLN
jgi:hypothetical protein